MKLFEHSRFYFSDFIQAMLKPNKAKYILSSDLKIVTTLSDENI